MVKGRDEVWELDKTKPSSKGPSLHLIFMMIESQLKFYLGLESHRSKAETAQGESL